MNLNLKSVRLIWKWTTPRSFGCLISVRTRAFAKTVTPVISARPTGTNVGTSLVSTAGRASTELDPSPASAPPDLAVRFNLPVTLTCHHFPCWLFICPKICHANQLKGAKLTFRKTFIWEQTYADGVCWLEMPFVNQVEDSCDARYEEFHFLSLDYCL